MTIDSCTSRQRGAEENQENPAIIANLILGPLGVFGMIIDIASGNAWEYSKKPLYFN